MNTISRITILITLLISCSSSSNEKKSSSNENAFFSSAFFVAEQIENDRVKVNTLINIATHLVDINAFDIAHEVLLEVEKLNNQSTNNHDKILNIVKLANLQFRINNVEKAQNLLNNANRLIQSENSISTKIYGYVGVAESHYKMSQHSTAKAILREASEITDRSINDNMRDSYLNAISRGYANLDMFMEAFLIANRIDNKNLKDDNLLYIVDKYLESNEFSHAIDIVDSIENPYLKGLTFINISLAQSKNGQDTAAVRSLNQAFIVSHRVSDSFLKASLLEQISSTFFEIGQIVEAEKQIDRILQIFKDINPVFRLSDYNLFQKVSTLSNIGVNYHNINKIELSNKFLEESVNISETISDKSNRAGSNRVGGADYRSSSFRKVSIAYGEIGQYEKAVQLARMGSRPDNTLVTILEKATLDYFSALQIISTMENPANKAIALSIFGKKYYTSGDILDQRSINLLKEITK